MSIKRKYDTNMNHIIFLINIYVHNQIVLLANNFNKKLIKYEREAINYYIKLEIWTNFIYKEKQLALN